MERKMLVIHDPQGDVQKWEDIFKLQFEKMGCLYVYNQFDAGKAFVSHLKTNSRDFFINGLYFVDKTLTPGVEWDPSRNLQELLDTRDMDKVPEIFVNGTYFGGVSTSDEFILFDDFMGLQKVYHYQIGNAHVFSTSIRLLAASLKLERDEVALREYLVMGQLFSGRSGFKGVEILAPATKVRFKDGKLKFSYYASFATKPENKYDTNELVDAALKGIQNSINSLYDKNIVYSMSLTGGMDSRIIYLNWPDKKELLTGTAGDGSSDYLKALEIVRRLGNEKNHALEDSSGDLESYEEYYHNCDNPLLTKSHVGMKHLAWKKGRGSQIHLSGVGGELTGGENLYMSRAPQMVLREAFLPYNYHPMDNSLRANLMKAVLGTRDDLGVYLDTNSNDKSQDIQFLDEVVDRINEFIGPTKFQECYTERLRTYKLASANYSYDSLQLSDYVVVMPYNDRRLINTVCEYHPRSRELRRMTMRLLQRDSLLRNLPVDTTHLPVYYPYPMQKVFRALRMVLNIGYHKNVPLLQKGTPPTQRVNPYFDKDLPHYRAFINDKIIGCSVLDKKRVNELIDHLKDVYGHNFYIQHGEAEIVMRLLRLSMFMEI
jgi:hypothetical protein